MRHFRKLLPIVMAIIFALSMNMSAYADSCGGFAEKDVYTPADSEVIKDPVLHWAVRSALNRIEDRPLLTEELVGQISGVSFEACAHPEEFTDWKQPFWIEDLEGMQYAKKATMIDICYVGTAEKKISSLEPISGLTKLRTLWLKQDGISDISALSGLVNMDHLELSSNEISDITAVAGMSKLTHLIVEYNKLTDVDAIENLSDLEYVNIANNNISSLPDMSKLVNLHYFDASGNALTNADVAKLEKCVNIEELNLNRNDAITDVKPLARLINLDATRTSLPVSADTKADLFAAINVNKLIDGFNISRMQESDIEYVQEALDAYGALTDEQKTYFDSKRIAAIRSNLELVMNGSDPVFYEEYDEGGGSHPVWDRVIVKAIDNHGNPLQGITFVKKSVGTNSYTTDSKGMVVIPHASWDMAWDLSVYLDPSETRYVAKPEKYEYEVNGEGKTYIINGEWATGYDEFVFELTPVDEYVDKSELKAAIASAGEVKESFRYTDASYKTFEEALESAKEAVKADSVAQSEIDDATDALNSAVNGLVKKDKLTALKITVKDRNGNVFARPFQVQAFAKSTGYKSYNDFTDTETGAVVFPALDTWTEGTEWAFQCCWREPYQFTCSNVPCTIGVEDGVPYFKMVNGKPVDADFELEVTVTPDTSNSRAINVALADKLNMVIESASEYDESKYTKKSYEALSAAIEDGTEISERIEAARAADDGTFHAQTEIDLQEEANAAVASIQKAEEDLAKKANTVALTKLVNMSSGYSKKMYTTDSWNAYETSVAEAEAVLEDDDASQSEVDIAAEHLRAAQSNLVLLADKTELGKLIDRAEAVDPDAYESGIEELNEAVDTAKAVYNKPEPSKTEVDAQVEALNRALNNLVAKKPEVSYECYEGVFRALVTDKDGKPVPGVHFKQVIDGKVATDSEPIVSNGDGVIQYYIWTENIGKTTEIKVSDDKYMSSDVHSFVASGTGIWSYKMTEVDGKPYTDGIKLKYVVKANDGTGGETPDPEDPDQPGGEDPDQPGPGEVNKTYLEEQINIAESMSSKASDYTKSSYDAMLEALKAAKAVFRDDEATQQEVDSAAAALKGAKEALVKVEKPVVCLPTSIRILLVDEDGNKISSDVPYTMTMYGNTLNRTARGGVIEYELSDGDSGVPSVTFALSDETFEFNGAEYTVDTNKHVFELNSSSLGVTIKTIDGTAFSGSQEVKFVFIKSNTGDDPSGDEDVDVDGLKKEIEDLKAELEETKSSLEAAEADVEEAQKKIKELETKISELESRLEASEGNQSSTDSKIEELEKLIDQMQKELDETKTQLEELKKDQTDSKPSETKPAVVKPAATYITRITAGKKSFKAVWKKKSVTGYQIRYSTKKSMSGAKVLTVSKNSRTVKKLKAKKKYYVQVRTYKKVSGKKYYSKWSAKKSIKTR